MRKFAPTIVGLSAVVTIVGLLAPASAAGEWQRPVNLGIGDLSGVSCASPTFCAAMTQDGAVSLYDGSSWSSPSHIVSAISDVFPSVSCPASTFCVASGQGDVSVFDGTSWGAATTIDTTAHIESISCPSSSFCMAVDTSGNSFAYSQGSWRGPTSTGLGAADGGGTYGMFLSCTSATFCLFVNTLQSAQFNGSEWIAQQVADPGQAIEGVSCVTSAWCIATDGRSRWLRFNGVTWTAPRAIERRVPGIGSISCPTVSFCAVVDGSARTRFFDGRHWSDATTISKGLRRPNRRHLVSCTSAMFCLDATTKGQIVFYKG